MTVQQSARLRQPGKSPSHCGVEQHARVLPKSVSRTAPNREQRWIQIKGFEIRSRLGNPCPKRNGSSQSKVSVNPHHHHGHFPVLHLRHHLNPGQDLAAVYCHHLCAVSTFLSSSLDQNTRCHILHWLKTARDEGCCSCSPFFHSLATTRWFPQNLSQALLFSVQLLLQPCSLSGLATTMTPPESHSTARDSRLLSLKSFPNQSILWLLLGFAMGRNSIGEVGTELAMSHSSVLHFLEGWNTCKLCPELPEGGCCILFSGQDSQSPARCVSLLVPTFTTEGYTARSQHTTSKCKSWIDFLPSVPNKTNEKVCIRVCARAWNWPKTQEIFPGPIFLMPLNFHLILKKLRKGHS